MLYEVITDDLERGARALAVRATRGARALRNGEAPPRNDARGRDRPHVVAAAQERVVLYPALVLTTDHTRLRVEIV